MTRAERLASKAADSIVSNPPDWLVALRNQGPVPGCTFLDDETIIAYAGNSAGPSFGSGLQTEAVIQYTRKHRPHLVQVAGGPEYISRRPTWSAWYVDSRAPDGLLFAPAAGCAPFLWIPAEGSRDGVAHALAGYFPEPWPTRGDLPKVARGFMGYLDEVGVTHPLHDGMLPVNRENLTNYFGTLEFTQPGWWGGSCLDDPYPEGGADASLPLGGLPRLGLQLQVIGETAKKQSDGVPSMTWRTAQSRSYLGIEGHRGELLIANVRYRPSNHPQVIEAMNTEFGCSFPVDLPVDVVGALTGFDFVTIGDTESALAKEADPSGMLGHLEVALALSYGDMDAVERLRRYFDQSSPAYRAHTLNMAGAYHYLWILEEMAVTEPEPKISEQLQRILNKGGTGWHPDVFAYQDENDEDDA